MDLVDGRDEQVRHHDGRHLGLDGRSKRPEFHRAQPVEPGLAAQWSEQRAADAKAGCPSHQPGDAQQRPRAAHEGNGHARNETHERPIRRMSNLVVEVADPRRLTLAEREALLDRHLAALGILAGSVPARADGS